MIALAVVSGVVAMEAGSEEAVMGVASAGATWEAVTLVVATWVAALTAAVVRWVVMRAACPVGISVGMEVADRFIARLVPVGLRWAVGCTAVHSAVARGVVV